ncbi:hypothetical protein [Devosia chinhatensis]|uniref:Uncharacterized protein n=1 Tax=Devosia chinhatensis TaxID=429727 RepID=A0A0F5FHM0_9HYPH|nr:hypothetical protein [Devosia chinhatensis]KKB08050.1 hypothetical protein VE26_15845 [Devosia chinhatensis]
MTDPYLDQRLARLEAIQADHASRIGRLEAGAHNPPPMREEGNPWPRIGLIALAILAAIWLLDELPGPPIWDRLF